MLPLKQILCPIDFSEPSLTAMDAACELAQHFNAELRVLNVVAPTSLPTDLIVIAATGLGPNDSELRVEALQNVNKIIVERVPSDVKAQGEVKLGQAPHEIVSVAEDIDADMIVMGTHGTTGWRHLAFGSVAEKVVRTAYRPVMTVHCGSSKPAEKIVSNSREMEVSPTLN